MSCPSGCLKKRDFISPTKPAVIEWSVPARSKVSLSDSSATLISKGDDLVECSESVIEIPGGELHANILEVTGLGRARSKEHFVKYFNEDNGDDGKR